MKTRLVEIGRCNRWLRTLRLTGCLAAWFGMALAGGAAGAGTEAAPAALERYHVVWTSPSESSAGSMPMGNGEVVLNAWVERGSGDLLLLVARTDAVSETCRFLKLGRVRVHWEGNPLARGGGFRQELKLREGVLDVTADGVSLRVWVDAASHVVHVTGASERPRGVRAVVECWRNEEVAITDDSSWTTRGAPFRRTESADVFLPPSTTASSSTAAAGEVPAVTWYHRNGTSVVARMLETQSLTGARGAWDPLLGRIFGGRLSGAGFVPDGPRALVLRAPASGFALQLATHTVRAGAGTVAAWREGVEREALQSADGAASLARTRAWWARFWARSWIFAGGERGGGADTAELGAITRGYVLQRYALAIQGRGEFPIKFNGGFFCVETVNPASTPDWRKWGDCYWWQNTRHMYHPMLAAGDTDLMEPLFHLYEAAVPLAESRTAAYHGARGVYFPETMTLFGTYGSDYVWDRAGRKPGEVNCPWWEYAWNQGPELVALMLDRWDYTGDEAFLRGRVLPMAEAVLRYFDTRFRKDARGRIVISPAQSVETYWHGVTNDAPTVAGLVHITRRLVALAPGLVSAEQRGFFGRMQSACPPIPVEGTGAARRLSPAETYRPVRSNVENPETYAIWPYREVSLTRPGLLAEGREAYRRRGSKLPVGWGYDGNVAALLGMADEAARNLELKAANSNPGHRWPATWGPNFDWLPDQNHGGNLMLTAQLMLLQGEAGGPIRLLPAWPRSWDVDFRLHAPGRTVVSATVRGGRLVAWDTEPASRRADVVLPDWAR